MEDDGGDSLDEQEGNAEEDGADSLLGEQVSEKEEEQEEEE